MCFFCGLDVMHGGLRQFFRFEFNFYFDWQQKSGKLVFQNFTIVWFFLCEKKRFVWNFPTVKNKTVSELQQIEINFGFQIRFGFWFWHYLNTSSLPSPWYSRLRLSDSSGGWLKRWVGKVVIGYMRLRMLWPYWWWLPYFGCSGHIARSNGRFLSFSWRYPAQAPSITSLPHSFPMFLRRLYLGVSTISQFA